MQVKVPKEMVIVLNPATSISTFDDMLATSCTAKKMHKNEKLPQWAGSSLCFQWHVIYSRKEKEWNCLTKYCRPTLKETFERFKFHRRLQKRYESFEEFLSELKLLSLNYNSG